MIMTILEGSLGHIRSNIKTPRGYKNPLGLRPLRHPSFLCALTYSAPQFLYFTICPRRPSNIVSIIIVATVHDLACLPAFPSFPPSFTHVPLPPSTLGVISRTLGCFPWLCSTYWLVVLLLRHHLRNIVHSEDGTCNTETYWENSSLKEMHRNCTRMRFVQLNRFLIRPFHCFLKHSSVSSAAAWGGGLTQCPPVERVLRRAGTCRGGQGIKHFQYLTDTVRTVPSAAWPSGLEINFDIFVMCVIL